MPKYLKNVPRIHRRNMYSRDNMDSKRLSTNNAIDLVENTKETFEQNKQGYCNFSRFKKGFDTILHNHSLKSARTVWY